MTSLDDARFAEMRWNTPLAVAHADLLLARLDVGPEQSLLDLGCGWGELLLRALSQDGAPREGIGVDLDESLLERGRARADELGLADRVRFVSGRAEAWTQPAQRVLCIGTAHAWGGTSAALSGLAELVHPGGRLLFGDGFWERPPSRPALELFGEEILGLPELASLVGQQGWRLLHLSTADQREWDEFESAWRAGREWWLDAYPDDPQAAALTVELEQRAIEYVMTYRGVLGFAYLVLGRRR